jgi:hypothetical protein
VSRGLGQQGVRRERSHLRQGRDSLRTLRRRRSSEDDPKHAWKVYALDKATGKILWEQTAYEGIPKVKRHPKSSHAASTPATDGKYLIVNFGSEGLYAYNLDGNLDGKLLWKQDLGVLDAGWFYDVDYQWEYGSSPIIYKNLVIVQADIQKNSFVAAYDLKTGKQVWKTPREELPSWGTPTVYEGATRAELITNGTKAIRGYDPATGKELWHLGPMSEITTPTPFVAHDLIFSIHAYTHRLWRVALHLLEPGRVDCLQREEWRSYLPGTTRRNWRRVHCLAGRIGWKDLSLERRRRRVRREGRPEL